MDKVSASDSICQPFCTEHQKERTTPAHISEPGQGVYCFCEKNSTRYFSNEDDSFQKHNKIQPLPTVNTVPIS